MSNYKTEENPMQIIVEVPAYKQFGYDPNLDIGTCRTVSIYNYNNLVATAKYCNLNDNKESKIVMIDKFYTLPHGHLEYGNKLMSSLYLSNKGRDINKLCTTLNLNEEFTVNRKTPFLLEAGFKLTGNCFCIDMPNQKSDALVKKNFPNAKKDEDIIGYILY